MPHGLTASGRFHPRTDTLVLDGIPRNLHQAEMLDDFLDVIAVFYMCSSSFKNLVARLQRRALKDNRLDDASLDVIKARLKSYEAETRPVLNFYRPRVVHRINTDGTPTETFLKVLRKVARLKPA